MAESLWGEEFNIDDTAKTKSVLKKIKNPLSPTVLKESSSKSKKIPIEERLKIIATNVYQILGRYKEDTLVIKTYDQLVEYIDVAIENGVIAIDTETNNSLEPITCKIMGACIYTPKMKNAYIPINHVDRDTGDRIGWQLTEHDLKEQFGRLNNTKIIMHNGKFDYQVIKCTCDIALQCYWDTMIASRLLDENERSAGLKQQYIAKIDSTVEKYSIDHLFEDIEYAVVDPELFALYAATDSYMTYRLYEWQLEKFQTTGMERLYKLFMEVEMPVVEVAAEMELTGITIDKNYATILSDKYHKQLEDINQKINAEIEKYKDDIKAWRETDDANYKPPTIDKKTKKQKLDKKGNPMFGKSKSEQLEDPMSVSSPTQLAILLYDVLKVPQEVDKKTGKLSRSTGEDTLLKIDLPICKLILDERGVAKLINTYIDKLPDCVCTKTNRLHAHFNQLGTDTGRFSSTEPNLQNIPSHNKEIRMMFVPQDGYAMIGSDFSQQEPRLLSCLSQDENMINAYKQGKDLYATMGVGVYHNDYWDNMEHHEDGSPNPEGKKRRSNMKILLLGIMYGMGSASIANDIGSSIKEAEGILDNFYKGFPSVKKWKEETESFAKTNGYVEDLWGRRRRLPDLFLPKYEIHLKKSGENSSTGDFNPLLGALGKVIRQKPEQIIKYEKLLANCRGYKESEKIKSQAVKDGVTIIDHGAHISTAERQCVNARVQGSAATMSKIAIRKVYDNPEMKKLGFKLLLQIHDEFIGECPKENAERASELLAEIMKTSVQDVVNVPFKCDAEISSRWYEGDYLSTLNNYYTKLIDKGSTPEDALRQIAKENPESSIFDLRKEFGVAN